MCLVFNFAFGNAMAVVFCFHMVLIKKMKTL